MYATQEEIKIWLKKMAIENFTINDDLTVDVKGDVYLNEKLKDNKQNELPVRFNHVEGSFECSSNSLISLRGCPTRVDGSFDCQNNLLKSLKFGPLEVGKSYICSDNKLVNLQGSPREIQGKFNCANNKIYSLKGGPDIVHQAFLCNDNKLKNLVGGPYTVLTAYGCQNNILESLEGFPTNFKGNLDISHNINLKDISFLPEIILGNFLCFHTQTTFKNGPKVVYGDVECNDCNIKSFSNIPHTIKGNLLCYNNPMKNNVEINCTGFIVFNHIKTPSELHTQLPYITNQKENPICKLKYSMFKMLILNKKLQQDMSVSEFKPKPIKI